MNKLLTVIVLCFVFGSVVSQELTFVSHTIDPSFDGPAGITAADLNSDGNIDIISAAVDNNTVAWWQNNPGDSITWTKRIIDDNFVDAIYVDYGDIDGDNNLDILASAYAGAKLAWWQNSGEDSIVWTKQIIDNQFDDAHEIMPFDINLDGDMDVIGVSAGLNTIAYYLNDGNYPVTWTKYVVDNDFPGARSVDAADIDNDGDIDLVGAALDSHEVVYWCNEGGEPIEWTKIVISNSFALSHKVVFEDINNDGWPDILGTAYTDGVKIWINSGEPGYIYHWTESIVSELSSAVISHFIDVENDGDLDVVSTYQGRGLIELYISDGDEPYSWTTQRIDVLEGVWPLYYGDIDNDNDMDFVCGGRDANELRWYENKGIETGYNFAPVGAEWYYTEKFAFSGDVNYIKFTSEKDTIINGIACKKIVKRHQLDCLGRPAVEFMYSSFDTVYFYDSNLENFQILYVFDAESNDSWQFTYLDEDSDTDTIQITVDSVSITTINEIDLRTLHVTYNKIDEDAPDSYTSTIIEGIGDVFYMFNYYPFSALACDANWTEGLRCFEDSVIGHYETGIADSCDLEYIWIGVDQISSKEEVIIFPNPANDIVHISGISDFNCTISDISGKVLISSNEKSIDISALKPGIYFLRIHSDKNSYSKKIIKL
jgi:type IX secretion system substrate protein/VCBS repeat protein